MPPGKAHSSEGKSKGHFKSKSQGNQKGEGARKKMGKEKKYLNSVPSKYLMDSRATNANNKDNFLNVIRVLESDNNYQAKSESSTASGAYQFVDKTWLAWRAESKADHACDGSKEEQDAAAAQLADYLWEKFQNWYDAARAWRRGEHMAEYDPDAGSKYAGRVIEKM